jgi:flagellar hook assembly protein FlgD
VFAGAIPRALALVPAPIPAHGPMVMTVSVPERAEVTLVIFDASGRRIVDLARGRWEAGDHPIPWDGRDRSGHEVSSGLYFARLEALGRTLNVRFVRMK